MRFLRRCAEIVRKVERSERRGRGSMRYSIVMVSHNGRGLLQVSVPSVLAAMEQEPSPGELVVVDAGSTDGSAGLLRSTYPSVRVVELARNPSFARANNAGIRASRGQAVILLNNDVVVEPDFLGSLLADLEDPQVFAAACKLLRWDRRTLEAEFLRFRLDRYGLVEQVQPHRNLPDTGRVTRPCPTWYAPACASAFRRSALVELGGLDEMFEPFYWDEIDLSYRAWKRGWVVLYEPRSRVCHKRQQTSGRLYTPYERRLVWETNRLLFAWSDLHDPAFVEPYREHLHEYLEDPVHQLAHRRALRKLHQAVIKRERERRLAVRSDTEVFRLVGAASSAPVPEDAAEGSESATRSHGPAAPREPGGLFVARWPAGAFRTVGGPGAEVR